MPKAKQICSTSLCLKVAVRGGRCKGHGRRPWANTSRRNLQRPADWPSRRRFVLRRDRGRCRKCGEPAHEVDHIVPVAFGGSWDYDNLWLLCGPCHGAKTFRDITENRK